MSISVSIPGNLRHFEHPKEKLSHYSKGTVDIEYRFQFAGSEWGELEGIANRTDFDLGTHSMHSAPISCSSTRRPGRNTLPMSSSPRPACRSAADDLPRRCLCRGRGPPQGRRRQAHRPAARPAARARQGGRPALSRNADLSPKARDPRRQRCAHVECRLDDAQAIGRRYRRQTRSARPSASPSTSTPSRIRRSRSGSATRWPRSASRSIRSRAISPHASWVLTRLPVPLARLPRRVAGG